MATEDDLAFEGTKNSLKGKVREIGGILSDDESQEAQGKAQAFGGKLQRKVLRERYWAGATRRVN